MREAEDTRDVTFPNIFCSEQLKKFLFVHLFGMYYVSKIYAWWWS
jgi:hypothetical protein